MLKYFKLLLKYFKHNISLSSLMITFYSGILTVSKVLGNKFYS